MIRRRLTIAPVILGVFALAALGYLRRESRPIHTAAPGFPPQASPPVSHPAAERRCIRVIDGDTIELEGDERVRLIGVDAPESVDPRRPVEPFGLEAAAFTRRMVEGKTVRLEYDAETRDQYGRTLAYIYLRDGTLLNAEIIRQGYGYAYTRFPHSRLQEFVGLEREAREGGRGLWAK